MLIYLKPLSLFPELHSDTLFGALTYAISELYPDKIESMLQEFENNQIPFLISSTFPFVFNNDEKIRFFPKIILNQQNNFKFDAKIFKDYKKIKFIEEKLFFDLIKGNIKELDILSNLEEGSKTDDSKDHYFKSKELLMSKKYSLDIDYGENVVSNNSINRYTNETEIFYNSGNEFKNMGLFFLIEFNDDNYKPLIKAAIKFLKDRGFGKDISTGKGHFDYEIDEDYSIFSFFDDADDLDYFVTLSRFIPNETDLKNIDESSSYEIGSKQGRSSSNELRKQVRFFKEGSVFLINSQNNFYGSIVKSGNPAVEYGFAFPLKCIGNKEVRYED